MRYLGLDYGTKTLGLSLSDSTMLIASSLKVIRYNSIDELFTMLDNVIKEYKIDGFVLGYPLNMDGTFSDRTRQTLEFKKDLEKRYKIEVNLMDERLTTVQAEKMLIKNDTTRRKRKEVIDKLASTIILQSYLDKRRRSEKE
jgi:putative holliday junction resolvase